MRLHRFFVHDQLPQSGDYLLSSSEIAHQISRVFRLEVDDVVILFCGDGFDYVSKIREMNRNTLKVVVTEKRESIKPPRAEVTLCQSIIKKDNCEWITEKATELGVFSVEFITSDRSEKKGINLERMNTIAQESAEQCGRGTVPLVSGPVSLGVALAKTSHAIIFDVGGEVLTVSSLNKILSHKEMTLFVGPEGGWSDDDKEKFKKVGAQVVSLPGNVLRSETAVPAILSLILLAPLK
jgi:16S rRNA (uracil1498-N3)-methyltransferase